jgi:hypothetical protein
VEILSQQNKFLFIIKKTINIKEIRDVIRIDRKSTKMVLENLVENIKFNRSTKNSEISNYNLKKYNHI